jgi:hypothetical protein
VEKILYISAILKTQDDLLKMLENDASTKTEVVDFTFKGTKIINANTTEMIKKRNLDFRVAHRFGNFGNENSAFGDPHTLYGIDNATDIKIGFDYGVTDKLTIGLARYKKDELYEGSIKYKVLSQTINNKVPVSIAIFANAAITGKKDITVTQDYNNFAHRISYLFQGIIARKITSNLSLEVLPTYLHRNFVGDVNDKNDLFALGMGGRYKFTRSSSIIIDYYYSFSDYRKNNTTTKYYFPFGIGWEVETGGHVFSIMFTNSAGIIENDYLVNTTDSWFKGGFKLSFIISRIFKV